MLWLNASREKIKSDHPGISITDLSKKAGEIWKGMSKEKKEVRGGGLCEELWPGFLLYHTEHGVCLLCRSGTARLRTPGGSTRKP